MKKEIETLLDVIGDYRKGTDAEITPLQVRLWLQQFDRNDRSFLLDEVIHLMKQCYLSKTDAQDSLDNILKHYTDSYSCQSVNDFLKQTKFLSCQDEYKSQTMLLEFMDDHIRNKYGISLDECGTEEVKYWLYMDDVLASGGTFKREVKTEIENYGVQQFIDSGITILNFFFLIHNWGYSNSFFMLKNELGNAFHNKLKFSFIKNIDNHPRINSYNSNPSFNNAFPKDISNSQWTKYLDGLTAERHREFAYRPDDRPKKEEFFSSPENRDRYEKIILNAGLKIISRVGNLKSNVRPLGIVSPSYCTFGLGSHCFTWRNISNTCPLIFWWENNGWTPLFSVANRGQ